MERLNIILDITRLCSLRCIHCNRNAGSTLLRELSLSEWKEIILRLLNETRKKKKGIRMSLQGGEPTMRKDFNLILSFMRRKLDCPVSLLKETSNVEKFLKFCPNILEVVTNCVHLNEHHFKTLAENPPEIIRVSLDSSNPKSYEFIHGGDFFFKVLDAIKKLQNISLVKLSFVLMQYNISEVASFLDLSQALGIRYIRFAPLIALGRARSLRHQLITSDDWIRILYDIIDWQKSVLHSPFISISLPSHQWKELEKNRLTFNKIRDSLSDIFEVSPLNFDDYLVISPEGEIFRFPTSYYESTQRVH